ncbi:MAG TPA: DNA cytosine methyltransferase [Bacteroidetes bacterium]|nr:DNA cytosine methyltransferase [Bacteroidota bacterium]
MSVGIYSFFSGSGFLDLGFEKTDGFKIDFVNEYHLPFLEAYKYSREKLDIPSPTFGYDSSDINDFIFNKKLDDLVFKSKLIHDLIGFIGGPPCPDFSVGGKNKGKDGENGKLSKTYIDLICNYKPDFFLFENVKGLYRTEKHRQFFEKLKKQLRKSGYVLTERLINSIEYGAPQDRDRIILIGFKPSVFSAFLNIEIPSELALLKMFGWEKHIKYKREKVFSLNWPTTSEFEEDKYLGKPENIILELTAQYWFEKNDVYHHPNSGHCFNPKSDKFHYILEGDDSKKSYKRLHRWRYSPTVAYGNNEVHLHPYKARRMSAAETLALQSLPKEFQLPPEMTLTNMFKTIGNGVPYLAGKGLAMTIIDFLNNNKNGKTNGKQFDKYYEPAVECLDIQLKATQSAPAAAIFHGNI